jgi:hypothetical protein
MQQAKVDKAEAKQIFAVKGQSGDINLLNIP